MARNKNPPQALASMIASVNSSAECGTFCRTNQPSKPPSMVMASTTAAQQQGAQRQAFGKLVDANGEHNGQFDCLAALLQSGCQRQSVHSAVNPERKHHRGGKFGEPVRRGLVKMAGRARGTDVIDIFGDDGEQEITRSRRRQKPPFQVVPTFRRDAAKGDAQQRARAEADEGAKLLMRPGEGRAQRAARQRDAERQKYLAQNGNCVSAHL